jgi:hypothetical protein
VLGSLHGVSVKDRLEEIADIDAVAGICAVQLP